jgi:hypothetical protein
MSLLWSSMARSLSNALTRCRTIPALLNRVFRCQFLSRFSQSPKSLMNWPSQEIKK